MNIQTLNNQSAFQYIIIAIVIYSKCEYTIDTIVSGVFIKYESGFYLLQETWRVNTYVKFDCSLKGILNPYNTKMKFRYRPI